MTARALAKPPPAEVTQTLHTLLEFGLWVALMVCLIWLIVSGGALWMAKFSAQPIAAPMGRILRSLIGAVMATTAVGFAVTFMYAVQQ
ncbi:hypothetical protein ACFYTQ_35410 [Nocardia sp. NPDC004068]|uniref:hypothetical protein n=1 Tax=Nocardia sp. NPDC004068 TaxID=3364303 RepID=UPI0036CB5E66